MKIYIDYIFIENFLTTYVLLKECEVLTNYKSRNKNYIIAALVDAIYVCIMLIYKISFLNFILLKLLLVAGIIYIAFLPKKTSQYVKLITMFLVSSIVNLGIFYFTRNLFKIQTTNLFLKIIIYTLNFFLCIGVCKKMWKIYNLKLCDNNLIYDVKVVIGKKTYIYKGFMDTGNSTYSFENNIPIVIANLPEKISQNELEILDSFSMCIASINSNLEEKVYIPTKFYINNEEIKVGIVFTDKKLDVFSKYNMILNFEIFKKNLRGISI
jgi:sigma-E processing peptidase SpoIIGA